MISKKFEFGKCQIQYYNLSYWPEHKLLVIKYQISFTLAGNLKIIVETSLKMAANRLFLGVVAILKPI